MPAKLHKVRWYYPTLVHVFTWIAVALVGYSIYYCARYVMFETRLFHLESVSVTGNRFVPEEVILAAAAVEGPLSLYEIDLDEISRRVLENRYVRGVSVSRQLPSTLLIDVEERRPAVYVVDRTIYMSDESGLMLKKLPDMPMGEIPMVTGLPVEVLLKNRAPLLAAIRLVNKIDEVDPALRALTSEIHISREEPPQLFLNKGGARVVLGPDRHYERLYLLSKLLHNEAMIQQLPDLRSIDLSFERKIVIRKKG